MKTNRVSESTRCQPTDAVSTRDRARHFVVPERFKYALPPSHIWLLFAKYITLRLIFAFRNLIYTNMVDGDTSAMIPWICVSK